MTRTRKIAAGAGALILLVLVVIINGAGSNPAKRQVLVEPVAVEVTPVAAATLEEIVSAVGTVNAARDVMVSAETAGRITNVLVKVGDHVRAGQVLVQVDDELKNVAVEQAKASLGAAEAAYRKAQRDYERSENLFSTGDVSDVERDAYRLGYRSAEAQYASAGAALKVARRAVNDAHITSPIDGIVASKKVEVGEMVNMGKEIANVVDLSSVKVKLSIPEEEVARLKVGQNAVLRLDAAPEQSFAGTVQTIGAKTENAMGHTYPVEVVVRNRETSILKAGMFARVDINANTVANALAVSRESIVNGDNEQPAVYVVNDNIATLHPIRIGVRSADQVQVLDGVRKGDLVISFGQKSLKDGSPVTYKQ